MSRLRRGPQTVFFVPSVEAFEHRIVPSANPLAEAPDPVPSLASPPTVVALKPVAHLASNHPASPSHHGHQPAEPLVKWPQIEIVPPETHDGQANPAPVPDSRGVPEQVIVVVPSPDANTPPPPPTAPVDQQVPPPDPTAPRRHGENDLPDAEDPGPPPAPPPPEIVQLPLHHKPESTPPHEPHPHGLKHPGKLLGHERVRGHTAASRAARAGGHGAPEHYPETFGLHSMSGSERYDVEDGPNDSAPAAANETTPEVVGPMLRASPEGVDLVAGFSPSDPDAVGEAVRRFLDRLDGIRSEVTDWLAHPGPVASWILAAAAVVAANEVRRRTRNRSLAFTAAPFADY